MFCNSLTKNKKPCKIMVSEKSHIHNGMRFCHIHSKKIEIESVEIKSPKIIKNTVRCISNTKSNTRCTKKTSHESHLCNIHQKSSIILKDDDCNFKSPCVNYKLNKKSDCCYICLEETETKLSCGHFIHNDCLLQSFNSSVQTDCKIFENKNKYFVITNCLYCKQNSIMKDIPITEKFKKIYNKKNKIKFDNSIISNYFINLFLNYDTIETENFFERTEKEFMEDLKFMIFDKFSIIIFDNYIQQKNLSKMNTKYKKINKKLIFENIQNISMNNYSEKLFKMNKLKIESFLNLLENIINKLINKDNVQDDIINLINII